MLQFREEGRDTLSEVRKNVLDELIFEILSLREIKSHVRNNVGLLKTKKI